MIILEDDVRLHKQFNKWFQKLRNSIDQMSTVPVFIFMGAHSYASPLICRPNLMIMILDVRDSDLRPKQDIVDETLSNSPARDTLFWPTTTLIYDVASK